MESVQPGDVFAIPDFRETCESLEISGPALPKEASFFALRNSFDEGPFEVPQDPAHNVGFFKLPPGLEGQNENDAGVVGVERSPPQAENDPSVSKGAHDDEDLWLAESTLIARPPQYQTWDRFNAPDSRIQAPLFITEQGPGVFDALLESQGQTSSASGSSLVTTREYCACLLALALGRGSVLFSWDSVKKSFVSELDTPRVTGCSAETIQGLQEMCLACGNYTRFLKMSAEKMHTTHASPSKVAVADLVDQLLLVIQSELGARGQEVVSLLQLQAAVRPVFSILGHFRSLVRKLSKLRSDEEIISLLFEQSQVTEHRDSFLRDATQEMLQSISRPWLDFAAEWTGLKAESGTRMSKTGPSKSFVKVANKSWIDDAGFDLEEPDYIFDERNMPSFIPADIAQLMFQTGRNLRFLWEYHPDHPLSDISTVDAASPPLLQWQFDWTAISRVEHKALAYEAALKKAIRERRLTGHQSRTTDQAAASAIGPFQIFGRGEDEIQQFVLTSMEEFDKDPPRTRDDKFGQLLRHRLFRGSQLFSTRPAAALATFNPHRSLIPLLSFGPIISCQSRVVNQECLRVLFNAHNLRQHLSVQKDFQLLGNGVFCSRISHALFDPEMDTAEREAGVALTGGAMGLRLSGRQTWPPASSELRLALMGVLSETYQGRQAASKNAPLKHAELPGDMSFAVRNLSNEEMEACMDPHSLEAMDFLRLSYKPPSTLLPIITPVILVKYDKIFKLLLRVLRMLYVANQLFRDMSTLAASGTHELDDTSLRFRIEAHHFVSCITTYFFDTGIAKPWSRFQTWLDSIELALRDEDAAVAADCGPDTLREHHERTLDQIMQTLLLRKRQQPVLELLEDIFRLILQFSQRHGSLTHGELQGTAPQGQGIEELYASFRKKVGVFLTVCRGLSEKRNATAKENHKRDPEDRAGEDDADANTIDRLVLLLDMTDYYLRRRPA